MRSQSWRSSGYPLWTITGLVVLVFLAVTPAHAQMACKLLDQAELESALKNWAFGGKATKFSGSTANSGDTIYDICSSEIVRSGQGNLQIKVVIVKNLLMDGGDAIRMRNAESAREGQWRVKGAQFEQKTVGKAICTLYGRPGVAASSVCAIPRAKGFIEVEVTAPSLSEIPSMDAVGTLVQQANGRL